MGVMMFDKLFGKEINFSNQVRIKKNCYSCGWSEEVESEFGTDLNCYCQPQVVSCHKRNCRGCINYKVDAEVKRRYSDYELVEE